VNAIIVHPPVVQDNETRRAITINGKDVFFAVVVDDKETCIVRVCEDRRSIGQAQGTSGIFDIVRAFMRYSGMGEAV
jgi:hypothetical protein